MTNGTILCLRTTEWLPSRLSFSVRVIWPGKASGWYLVVFSKLSKLLNQEDALSAPYLRGDFCSPQAPFRGAEMLRTDVIVTVTLPFVITES
jgi:hypothetical protein